MRVTLSLYRLDIHHINRYLRKKISANCILKKISSVYILNIHKEFLEDKENRSLFIIKCIRNYIEHFKPKIMFLNISELVRIALSYNMLKKEIMKKELNRIEKEIKY